MLAVVPFGADQVVGEALVPENLSILALPDARTALVMSVVMAELEAVTIYPLEALVETVTSWAPILGVPAVRVPKGMVAAVVVILMLLVPPFKLPPDETPATVKVRLGSTLAVTAIDEEVSIAKAAVP